MRRSRTRGRHGDFLVVDDRTGFTEWRSDCTKQWNVLLVHRRNAETRHPQELIRAPRERVQLQDPRPDLSIANSNSHGSLVTTIAADAAGDNNQYAPMGPIGMFAIGQTDEGDEAVVASNSAGAYTITVDSTSGIEAGHQLAITPTASGGDTILRVVDYVQSPSILVLLEPLPVGLAVGDRVVDYSAQLS